MAKKVTFTLAPEIVAEATEGLLLGDFNNWLHEAGIKLKKQKDGSLKASTELEPGIYQYRYFLNDGRWVNDSNANSYAFNPEFGVDNCIIKVAGEVKETLAKDVVVAAPAKPKKATVAKPAAAVEKKAPAAKAKPTEKTTVKATKVTTPKVEAPKAAKSTRIAPKAAPAKTTKTATTAKKTAKKAK